MLMVEWPRIAWIDFMSTPSANILDARECQVAFVSVTQQISTANSMGRDKNAAARRKAKWSVGRPVLGYDIEKRSSKIESVASADVGSWTDALLASSCGTGLRVGSRPTSDC